MKKLNKFENWLFEGLNARAVSNKYTTFERVNEAEDKICIKVADSNLIKTRYGYALILDTTHVVFVKEWAVNGPINSTYEVILTKEYFNVKEWGVHEDFFPSDGEELTWEYHLGIAKQQNAVDEDGDKINPVRWRY